MRSVRVPSSGTSAASTVADSSTSPTASAGRAKSSARQSALPVLLRIASLPHVGLLLRKAPGHQVLLARPQRVEQPLRLAAVDRLVVGSPLRPLLLRVAGRLLRRGLTLRLRLLLRVALLLLRRSRILWPLLLLRRIALLRIGLLLAALLPRLVLFR